MNVLQTSKVINAIPPTAIKDNAAFVSKVIDTRGLSYGEFHALLGSIDAAAAVFKVMESDEKTDANTLGGVPTTVKDLTTKPGATDDDKTWIVGISFVSAVRKRYIQLQATAGDGAAGTFLAASFVGIPDGVVSSTTSDRGVGNAEYV